MTHNCETPPRLGRDGVECQKPAAFDNPLNSTLPDNLQSVRAAFLMRRLPIDAAMARAVAAIAFLTMEGGQ
jgi:hypothetical protein